MNNYHTYLSSKKNVTHSEMLNEKWHKVIKLTKYSELEEQFEKLHGLSTLEIGIISTVSYNTDIIFREICEELKIPKTTLTSVIDRLEERNYVKRIISKRDKRSFGLELTDEGKLAQKEHLQFEYAVCDNIMNALDTDEEKLMLFTLIDKMIRNLKK